MIPDRITIESYIEATIIVAKFLWKVFKKHRLNLPGWNYELKLFTAWQRIGTELLKLQIEVRMLQIQQAFKEDPVILLTDEVKDAA